MTVELDRLQSTLDGDLTQLPALSGPHRRLVDAWRSDQPGLDIVGDLGALIAQVLRHEREVSGQASPVLRMRLDDRGVPEEKLRASSLVCTRFGLNEHTVRLGQGWAPLWLSGDARWIDVACASPGPLRTTSGPPVSTYSRPTTPITIDPAIASIAPGITQYRSRTQASALRTATLGNPRSALHVVLPTGSGKSLVGLAPGLLRSTGSTVVVVPTIALALDQERATHSTFPGTNLPDELAYYGDRNDGGKERILQRIRAGTQRVVFTSPEAFVSSLASPLRALAASGGLTSVVVDEAHLIRSWGLDFRPEYQIVGSLVSELRAAAIAAGRDEPHVILMTATLSEEALKLNETLFHGSSDSMFVGSAYLRTELRFLHADSPTNEVRIERLVEAMHHLPRPAIVYTTRKKDAEELAVRLRQSGFSRTDVFHGDLDGQERLRVLERWSGHAGATATDLVVGTSAFGLGVDQSDVRAVVHACVPASVDRYYQEVGRAGRDGHAAVAVWLSAPDDINQARGVESATLIGDEKAWDRWQSMRMHALRELDDGALAVDTSIVPPHLHFPSDSNQLWNRNTLTLMERAGLVRLEPVPPPEINRSPEESEEAFEKRLSAAWGFFNTHVRVLTPNDVNLNLQTFTTRLADLRESIRRSESESHKRVEQLLQKKLCWGHLIAAEYRLRSEAQPRVGLSVAPACSGCPAVEHQSRPNYASAKPLVAEAHMPVLAKDVDSTLRRLAGGGDLLIVGYAGSIRLTLQSLVQRTVTRGIRGILADPNYANLPALTQTPQQAADEGLVLIDTVDSRIPQVRFSVPTLILLDHGTPARQSWVSPSTGPFRIVVIPEQSSDPTKHGQRIMDYRSPAWTLEELMARI